MKQQIIDIKSDAPYPAGDLSNFAAHGFAFRGVACASMEGLLQSVKFRNAAEQIAVCALSGRAAKDKGATANNWQDTQTLWWKEIPMARDSIAYQQFLDEAFAALFAQNAAARKALVDTGTSPLAHSIGIDDPRQTVLTTGEFIDRLEKERRRHRGMEARVMDFFGAVLAMGLSGDPDNMNPHNLRGLSLAEKRILSAFIVLGALLTAGLGLLFIFAD